MEITEDLEEKVAKSAKSTLVSRNVTIQGKRTSVRLEPEMWAGLHEIAKREQCSGHDICTLVSLRKKENTSLTAAIRVFIMLYFRAASTEDGHRRVGHGNFANMKQRAGVQHAQETRAFWNAAAQKPKENGARVSPAFLSNDTRAADRGRGVRA